MAIEIERKFLVLGNELPALTRGTPIKQGYIPTANGTTVRVRLAGDNAYLCLKSPARNITRQEYEYAIPLSDGQEMLELFSVNHSIEKHRYLIDHNELRWELDTVNN